MLFVFGKPKLRSDRLELQGADGQSRVRNVVAEAPVGPLGLIRTSNVG